MPDFRSYFLDQRSTEPWAADADLIEYLVNWLETTCLLKGHQLRPAVRVADPEAWRKQAARALAAGRNDDTIATRNRVLRAIRQTEPALAEKLPDPMETLDTPDVKIADAHEE